MLRIPSVENKLVAENFNLFVRHAFRIEHGTKLGDQPYVEHMCHMISQLLDGDITRLLINLPPQHLKSFVCTVCAAAYLLGKNPRLRILLVAYNDAFAEALASRVRDLMQASWYRDAFATRIKGGHARANDFGTTSGGGVFAVSATGAVTGRTADVLLYDDPHEILDWNNERKLDLVRNNFNTLLSRLQNKVKGKVLVAAHRVNDADLSAYLLEQGGWTLLRLPLRAQRTREFEPGHDVWLREKGDVLRPDAYPRREIERLEKTQVAPPFALFHQQGEALGAGMKIKAEHFQSYSPSTTPIGPVVISIDPGHGGHGSESSPSAIQAWKTWNKNYYLIDEFCKQCDVEVLRKEFWRVVRKYNPSLALVEKTADGPALHALVHRKARFEVRLVTPQGSKSERLNRHRSKIRKGRIYLPDEAIWRTTFIDEIKHFPGGGDDRVDAMTQYLDFASSGEKLPTPRAREHGGVIVFSPSRLPRW
jgi:predicted phage terminase large subunit-like protein